MLRRLATGERAGLTAHEAARRLRLHGPNLVVRSHRVKEGGMFRQFLMTIFSL